MRSELSPFALLSLLTVVWYFFERPQRVSFGFTTWTAPPPVDLVEAVFETVFEAVVVVAGFFFVVVFEGLAEAVAREAVVPDGFDFGFGSSGGGGGGGASVYS